MNKHSIDFHIKGSRNHFDFNLRGSLPTSGISFIYGPSGSGKTTLLRVLAGLEQLPETSVSFAGECWQNETNFLAPHQRRVGYVFQEPSLFPHMSVRQNIEYGWKRTDERLRQLSIPDVIERLGLSQLLSNGIHNLSGGQKQRVALARALLTSPQLLLLDEPFANLDHESKQALLRYLEQLQKEFGTSIIYVSHAIEEALVLAEQIVLMENGRISAAGAVNEILTDPALPIAQLDEACSILPGLVSKIDSANYLSYAKVCNSVISLSRTDLRIDERLKIRIRASDVSLSLSVPTDTSINNIFPVTVLSCHQAQNPAHTLIRCQVESEFLLARITKRSLQKLGIHKGQGLFAQIKSVSIL